MRIGGLVIPDARETVAMMYEFEKPFVVDSNKFTQTFGDISTPLDEATKTTADCYQAWVKNNHD